MGRMSALKDRLRTDLTAAIKARDEVRSSTLRMVLTAITNAEVAGKQARELTDDDVVGVLSTEAKKRREAATAFEEGGRAEMADKEKAEAAVIADYLPEQLTDGRSGAIVTAAVEQVGAAGEGMRAMGKVMGVVQPQVKGRADGSAVAAEVRRQLGLSVSRRRGRPGRASAVPPAAAATAGTVAVAAAVPPPPLPLSRCLGAGLAGGRVDRDGAAPGQGLARAGVGVGDRALRVRGAT